MIKKFSKSLYLALIAVLVLTGSQFVYGWVSAPPNPPANNIDAPVNVGTLLQHKNGTLGLESLAVFGDTVLVGNVRIASGSPAPGKVLTSDANGNVSWTDLSGGSVTVIGGETRPCPADAVFGRIGTSMTNFTCTYISDYYCAPKAISGYGTTITGGLAGTSCYIGADLTTGTRSGGSSRFVSTHPSCQSPSFRPSGVTVFDIYPATRDISCPTGWNRSGDVCI